MHYHHYCNNCFFKVADHYLQNCPKCEYDHLVNGNKWYFIEFPIINQMMPFFKCVGFYERLQYRFRQNRRSTDNIEDIYDGLVYEKHFKNYGFLANPNNISFLWNTDAVPLFKSSNISTWPIFLIINELEPSLRFKIENIIFAGIWYSSKKPEAALFLEPLYKELKLLKEGIKVNIPTADTDTYSSKLIKAILIAGTFDLPARCLISGSVQFNGKYGCIKCLQQGESHKTKKGGNVWIYPFNIEDPKGPIRKEESFRQHALEACNEKKIVFGVKYPTWLHGLQSYDLVNGVGIDYMHGVMLGVVKLLLKLWFSNEHKAEKYNAYGKLTLFDERLNIKPTFEVTRPPRSNKKFSHDWKASEYCNFLLFYGVPVLVDILPTEQLAHFSLLSHSIHKLLQCNISNECMKSVEKMILKFCQQFQEIYGKRYMLANIHQLLHLCDNVKHLGPLWTHSCFPFEDKNKFILQLIHGSQKIECQLNSAINVIQSIPNVVEKTI